MLEERSREEVAQKLGVSVATFDVVIAAGGDGVISVTSNATPRRMTDLVTSARRDDLPAARRTHLALTPWMRAAFVESNPLPVKAALHLLRMMGPTHRLPLVPLADQYLPTVRAEMIAAGALTQ